MAYALVTGLRVYTKVMPGQCYYIISCVFWGDDVSTDIEGTIYDLGASLNANYSLSDLKSALVSAVQSKALDLGFTVASLDMTLPSLETG